MSGAPSGPPVGPASAGLRRRVGPVSTAGGALALLAGVLSLLAGGYLLLLDPPVPVAMGADGRVVLEQAPGLGGGPAVVYAAEGTSEETALVQALACRAETPSGGDAGVLLDLGEPDRDVDGRVLVALAETGRIRGGGIVVCEGAAVATTEGLAVGWGRGSTTTGGVVALGFGVLALVAGAGFLAVGAAARAGRRA